MNFFLPSFKLKSKTRTGAKVSKKYEAPATPFKRLLTNARMIEPQKAALRETFNSLDPVRLLSEIRAIQHRLTKLEVCSSNAQLDAPERSIDRFVESLATAWKAGEVRPTHRKPTEGPRPWRTRLDPFANTWALVEQWLNDQPDANAKELLQRLQQADPTISDNLLRTLQRRVKEWRTAVAPRLVVGVFHATPEAEKEAVTP